MEGHVYRRELVFSVVAMLFIILCFVHNHYSDVILSAMASQITGVTIVCLTVFLGADQRKKIKAPSHWPLWGESTGEPWIPLQMANNAKFVSIWWRHHVCFPLAASLHCNFRAFILFAHQCSIRYIKTRCCHNTSSRQDETVNNKETKSLPTSRPLPDILM